MAYERDNVFNYKSKYTLKENENVLANKLGLLDEESLQTAERMVTTYKLAKLYIDPGKQTFDVEHYCSIHRFLFDDIYPFAGEIRKENISKRIPFCLVQFILPELERVLKEARASVAKIDDRDKLLKFITVLYSDLDIIHPFREGNGRTEREFLRQFIDYICKRNGLDAYYLDYSLIEDREAYIDAVVKADARLEYGDLMVLFDSILVVRDKSKEFEDGFGKK